MENCLAFFVQRYSHTTPKHCTPSAPQDFTLPCTTKEFWVRFLSNKSSFFKEFHERRGDTDVEVTAWQKHSHEGMVRDMQFVTPLKMKMGPPTTLCSQSQQCIVSGCGGERVWMCVFVCGWQWW